jgi:DNA repair exonuclease SbcCD ATPase subunit
MGIPITWYALAANTDDLPPHNAQYNYTSKEAPVEADEYERQRQRAETAEAAQAALEARNAMHSQLWERVMELEQKLSAAISRAADAEKTEAAFSRLQSEHSDLIERKRVWESLQEQYARDMGVLHKNTTERDRLRLYADKALAMLRSFPASRVENLFSPGNYSQRDDDASAVGWWLAEVRRFLQDDVRQP